LVDFAMKGAWKDLQKNNNLTARAELCRAGSGNRCGNSTPCHTIENPRHEHVSARSLMSCTRWVIVAASLLPCWVAAAESALQPERGTRKDSRWSLASALSAQAAPAAQQPQLAQATPAAKPAEAPALPPPEQVAAPPPPRFDIARFDVQGNTLLSSEEIDEAVAPYVGKSKDFADVQRALESLQASYRRRGFGVVQVVLPEQELEGGVIVLRVVEPRLGKITVEGNESFDQANIRRSLPTLQEGATPNALEIGRNARLANDNPAKRTTVLLRPAANEGEIGATVRVQDEKFWRAAVSFDDTGSPATGKHRLGLAYQHANLFDLDNVVTIQYQLDPGPLRD